MLVLAVRPVSEALAGQTGPQTDPKATKTKIYIISFLIIVLVNKFAQWQRLPSWERLGRVGSEAWGPGLPRPLCCNLRDRDRQPRGSSIPSADLEDWPIFSPSGPTVGPESAGNDPG
jgi:hypothetical protein